MTAKQVIARCRDDANDKFVEGTAMITADELDIFEAALDDAAATVEALRSELEAVKQHSRLRAADIMKLGQLVYDASEPPVEWKARAEALRSELEAVKREADGVIGTVLALGLTYETIQAMRAFVEKHGRDG